MRQVGCERAVFAAWRTAAVCLAHGYDERVELVIELHAVLRTVVRKGLPRERGEAFVSADVARNGRSKQPVALCNAAEILVGNGN